MPAEQAQDQPGRKSKSGPPRLSWVGFYAVDRVLGAFNHQYTVSRCDDISIPGNISAVGELGDKAVFDRRHDERRFVGSAGSTSDVADQRERSTGAGGPQDERISVCLDTQKNARLSACPFDARALSRW